MPVTKEAVIEGLKTVRGPDFEGDIVSLSDLFVPDLEVATYGDVAATDGELDSWLERDPLGITERQLLQLGATADRIEQITQDAREDVAAARERALASPPPSLESRFTDILA